MKSECTIAPKSKCDQLSPWIWDLGKFWMFHMSYLTVMSFSAIMCEVTYTMFHFVEYVLNSVLTLSGTTSWVILYAKLLCLCCRMNSFVLVYLRALIRCTQIWILQFRIRTHSFTHIILVFLKTKQHSSLLKYLLSLSLRSQSRVLG
jgi:hypothetical protein